MSVSNASRQAATVSARILAGELPGSINTSPVRYSEPRYDWRELQRWKISERNLPEGSEVHFRTPGIWEQYRPQLTAGIAAMLLQAGVISWLLIERRRRQFAQADASDRRRLCCQRIRQESFRWPRAIGCRRGGQRTGTISVRNRRRNACEYPRLKDGHPRADGRIPRFFDSTLITNPSTIWDNSLTFFTRLLCSIHKKS